MGHGSSVSRDFFYYIWENINMKKIDLILISFILIFIGTLISVFVLPRMADKSAERNEDTAKIVYSEHYTESVRESITEELYGNREQYATDRTGSRADYVDKEASTVSGQLVIDEERMQAVYDSKLKEYDDMVDHEKVDALVKERQEQLVEQGVYKGYFKKESTYSREMMYWKNGGKYFAIVELFGMILYVLYIRRKKS